MCRITFVAALAVSMVVPVLIWGAATPTAAAPAPITIALITSETGPAAPQDVGTAGAFEARLDEQNAQGGVDGHKLVPLVIDDQTSPTLISTDVQEAISRGAIGIVSESPVFFLAAKYAQQAGVPVTGDDSDGPEWGEQPYTNMFASVYGSLDPSYPVNTMYGKVIKQFGGSKLATYAIGISPDSVRANSDVEQSLSRVGGKTVVNDASVPFGSVDFTSAALIAKQDGVNALWPNLDNASDIALTEAYKQAGIKLKVDALPVGYSSSLIQQPGLVRGPGRNLRERGPSVPAPQCRYQADADGAREVRPLHQGRFPELFRVQRLARRRPHDQGPRRRRSEPDARGRGQVNPQHQELQRQRTPPEHDQLLNRLRARPADLHLDASG